MFIYLFNHEKQRETRLRAGGERAFRSASYPCHPAPVGASSAGSQRQKVKGISAFPPSECILFVLHHIVFPVLLNVLIYIFLSGILAIGYTTCKMD